MAQDKVANLLAGWQAENIFKLLHELDLGCVVYRTGSEHLHPQLFQTAFERRKKFHNNGFHTSGATELFSNPDFTVISPKGNIAQFEVKFRSNGWLSDKDAQKYLEYHPYTFIFLISAEKPYFRILQRELLEEFREHQDDEFYDGEFEEDKEFFREFCSFAGIEPTEKGELVLKIANNESLIYTKETFEKYTKILEKWIIEPKKH